MSCRFVGIGVNHYPNMSPLPTGVSADLDYAAHDCAVLAGELDRHRLLSAKHILADGHGTLRPWRGAIWRLIRAVERADDPIFLYFAGHGLAISGELHICPGDFDAMIPDKTAISVSDVIAEIFPKAPWVAVVLDCCRAPLAGPPSASSLELGGTIRIADNVAVMFACSHGEHSMEAAVIGDGFGGVFSHFLAQSFRRAFETRPRKVAVREVFNSARDETSDFVNGEGYRQVPRMIGVQGDDLYFVRGQS